MPKYIAAVESWGDKTGYVDWFMNIQFEINPLEIIGGNLNDFKRTLWVNSVEDMVDKVISAAGGSKIWWLVIDGHGGAGWQSVGCGKDNDPDNSKHLSIETNGELCGDAESHLKRLKTVLSTNAIVSLGGCQTGKGTKGELLLQKVSSVLGDVKVEAGVMDQVANLPGYEGPVRSCRGNSCQIRPNFKLKTAALERLKSLSEWEWEMIDKAKSYF